MNGFGLDIEGSASSGFTGGLDVGYRKKTVMKDQGYVLNDLMKSDAIYRNGDSWGKSR